MDEPIAPRLFVLSPARCNGPRAAQLARSPGELGRALRAGKAPIGDVFAWLSALYFRGKLAYGTRFGSVAPGLLGCVVMAQGRGLVAPSLAISDRDLAAMGEIDVESDAFVVPLRRAAEHVLASHGQLVQVVLLGSIATGKYVDALIDVLGARLVFPSAFVGRGDMSRGGLLLRAARDGVELEYAMIAGATRHGKRPPRLTAQRAARPRQV